MNNDATRSTQTAHSDDDIALAHELQQKYERVRAELGKVILGQEDVVELVLFVITSYSIHYTKLYEASQTFVVIVSGIGGEPLYSERFRQWSETMLKAAESRLSIARDHIVYLSESEEGANVRVDGRSSKEELKVALSRLGVASRPGDVVLLLLIGHGSVRRDEALFNLPGPDVSASELNDMRNNFV